MNVPREKKKMFLNLFFFSPHFLGSGPSGLRRRRNINPSGFLCWYSKEQHGAQWDLLAQDQAV